MKNASVAEIASDLRAEQDSLDEIVASMPDQDWELATPSPRWAVRDQVGHLAFFDRTAALAVSDPPAFQAHLAELFPGPDADDEAMDRLTLGKARSMAASGLLAYWREARTELAAAANALTDDSRIEWYGPSMGAKSFLTARLMEAWAHGQDIVDALELHREPTDRLRHIARLGVITRGWSYAVRGEEAPTEEVAINLLAPDGTSWAWGAPDANSQIAGLAEDFCLVVTQRRHPANTGLEIHGAAASSWMERAQVFAGGPTSGPRS